jgi:hypothetical protein
MMLEGFLIGVIVSGCLVAGLFFLRFWRRTGDLLFLAFALSFLIEGANRARFLFLDVPSEGAASIYVVRLLSYLLILAAIAYKNLPAKK